MRRTLFALTSLTLFCMTCASTASFASIPSPHASLVPINRVVASVNDDIITQSNVDQAYHRTLQQMKHAKMPIPNKSRLKNSILEQLILEKLQLQLAKRYQITASNADVHTAIDSIAKQNHLTTKALYKKLKATGLSKSLYQKTIRHQIIFSRLHQAVLGHDVHISPDQIQSVLHEYASQPGFSPSYHLMDARISLDSDATNAQKQQAEQTATTLYQRLSKGMPFSDIKPGTATVTDLGFRPRADLPNVFVDALEHMKLHAISKPILTDNGYHILHWLGEQQAKHALPSRDQITRVLQQQAIQKKVGDWLKDLRQNAHVEIFAPQ